MELKIDNILQMTSKHNKKWFMMENHPLNRKEVYIKELYLTMLTTAASIDGSLTENEVKFMNEIIEGINMTDELGKYISKGLTLDDDKISEFIKIIGSDNLKYNFIVDSLVLSRIDGNINKEEIKIISEFAEILGIKKQELTYLTELSKAVLIDEFHDFNELKEKYGPKIDLEDFRYIIKFREIEMIYVKKGTKKIEIK